MALGDLHMELIIGGCFQGKTAYGMDKLKERKLLFDGSGAREIIVADGETCTWEQCAKADLVTRFHLLLRRTLTEGSNEPGITPKILLEKMTDQVNILLEENPDLMIVCDEVGCGIIPIERSERDYREAVGRVLCLLAKQATSMERVVAGMPVSIK